MFIYKQWDLFCKRLKEKDCINLPAASILRAKPDKQFIILKHDVETNPKKALRFAQIESKHTLKGSYYVQAYLLHNTKNIEILKQIQELGHEVSYHHDVMDSNKGDLQKALEDFQRNVEMFKNNGFTVETVCQHGNPVIERVGYSSNRDLFRDSNIASKYKNISEIMVNFKTRLNKEYQYISDAGYGWKIIFDPENNDILKSDDRDIPLGTLDRVFSEVIERGSSAFISTHPHRWHSNAVTAQINDYLFKTIKIVARGLLKFPFTRKVMERFYYLAKKI